MDNNKRKFVDKFTMFAAKLGNEIHLRSLRDAFATMMPLYILAGLAVLLNNTVFTWIFSGDTLANVQYWGTVIANGTLNVSGLAMYVDLFNLDIQKILSTNLLIMVPMIVAYLAFILYHVKGKSILKKC